MIKVDLITGFLGSGKTTFIKRYARYLMDKGLHIGIILNDYGAVNVDMMLLSELSGDRCDLSMVAGGCDADCHRRRFKTKLISMGMIGYDRILIEPSGIFDMDEFFDVLEEEPLNQWFEPGNVIALVEADLPEDLSEASDYFLASQIAHAGKIVLSKIQTTTSEELACTLHHLNTALAAVQCGRSFSEHDILQKSWDNLILEDWEDILSCGYRSESYVKLPVSTENDYNTLYYMNVHMKEEDLPGLLERMIADSDCGNIVRIKGFLPDKKGGWIEANATRKQVTTGSIDVGQEIFIVIGENLNKDVIDLYWESYIS